MHAKSQEFQGLKADTDTPWATGCPHWIWGSLLLWLPQPRLLEAISAKVCCMQQPRDKALPCDCNRWLPYGGASGRVGSRRRRSDQSQRSLAANEVVHYRLPETTVPAQHIFATERPSACADAPEGGTAPELSKFIGSASSRSSSPSKFVQPLGRASPCSHTRLFTVSIENTLMEEPRSALLSQQRQHKNPRLPPARKGDDMPLHSADPISAKHRILASASAISSQPGTKGEPLSRVDNSKTRGASQWHPADAMKAIDGNEPTFPLLQEAVTPSVYPPSLESLGERRSSGPLPPSRPLQPVEGLFASKILHESTHSEEFATGVPGHSGHSALGQILIAPIDHPKELVPQSVMQKKKPLDVQALRPGPREATRTVPDSSSSFLAALLPVAHSGSATATRSSEQAHGDALSDKGHPASQVFVDGPKGQMHIYLPNESVQSQETEGQAQLADTRQTVPPPRRERATEGDSSRMRVSKRQPEDLGVETQQKDQLKQGRPAVCRGAQHATKRILRSKTVAGSATAASNAPGQSEPTSAEKSAPNKGDLATERHRGVERDSDATGIARVVDKYGETLARRGFFIALLPNGKADEKICRRPQTAITPDSVPAFYLSTYPNSTHLRSALAHRYCSPVLAFRQHIRTQELLPSMFLQVLKCPLLTEKI
ncbi:hypothetical protein Esti_002403 [Eimeria stiedai]